LLRISCPCLPHAPHGSKLIWPGSPFETIERNAGSLGAESDAWRDVRKLIHLNWRRKIFVVLDPINDMIVIVISLLTGEARVSFFFQ
jgi:hypothetical protein